jgi:hypothetical protein
VGCGAAAGGVQPGGGSKALFGLAARVGAGWTAGVVAGGSVATVGVWTGAGEGCGAAADRGGVQPGGGSKALFGFAGRVEGGGATARV